MTTVFKTIINLPQDEEPWLLDDPAILELMWNPRSLVSISSFSWQVLIDQCFLWLALEDSGSEELEKLH